jgi:TRAP-type uncharacterized transport system fused permease subunit
MAAKLDLKPVEEKIPFSRIARQSYFLVPILVLTIVIFEQQGGRVEVAGFYGLISLLGLYVVNKVIEVFFRSPEIGSHKGTLHKEVGVSTRAFVSRALLSEKDVFARAIRTGVQSGAGIAVATGIIGLFFHVLGFAPLTQILADNIVQLSGGSLFVILLMTAGFGIFLGFGLPTVACYIAVSSLLAIVIANSGLDLLAIHLFIFYYAILSAITFPDAVAVLAAVGLSRGRFFVTTLYAMEIGVAGLIVPFAFVYDNALLMRSSPLLIIFAFGAIAIGITSMAAAFEGFWMKSIGVPVRILLFIGGIATFFPQIAMRSFGIVLFVVISLVIRIRLLKNKQMGVEREFVAARSP